MDHGMISFDVHFFCGSFANKRSRRTSLHSPEMEIGLGEMLMRSMGKGCPASVSMLKFTNLKRGGNITIAEDGK